MTETAAAQERARELARDLQRNEGRLLDLWRRTRIDWSFASDRLAQSFRRDRSLGAGDRRFVAETIYGMIRHARRIDEGLTAGGVSFATRAPDRERLLAYLVLEEGLSPQRAMELAPGVDWERVAAIDELIAKDRDAVRRIARRHSLPDWLAKRLAAEHPEHAEALAAALGERAPMTIRANLLVNDREELAAALAEEGVETTPGRFGPWALRVETRLNLFSLGAFRRGAFEAQDEGSQLIAEVVAPPPRGLVVDFCAGAGGKTLALAAMLSNRGRVIACDVDGRKLGELRRRARRAGVTNVQTVVLDPASKAPLPGPLERIAGRADRVLVDAPCSGIGSLRRNPEARWRLQADAPERLAAEQLAIADRAAVLLAPGGRLVYATCTVLDAENRNLVRRLEAAHPELEPVLVKDVWGRERASAVAGDDGRFLEVFPDRHGTDGFFAAILRRPRE